MTKTLAYAARILLIFSLGTSLALFQSYDGSRAAAAQMDEAQADSPETLRVNQGKSFVLNSNETIVRVSVTDEAVASAIVISPRQVLIHGVKPGTVSFMIWNEAEEVRAFDLQVLAVPMNLNPLRETLGRSLPGQDISVSQSGPAVVLTGNVASPEVADQAAAIARTASENVVNLLVPAQMKQTVLLEVKFAEVNRNAVRQLGMNILSTGALNTPGIVTTGQFGGTPNDFDIQNSIGAPLTGFSTEMELTDLLNIFVFRPDLNLGLLIKAMQQQALLQTLAEPNLIALGGKEASFLAGGEFPVPVVQGTSGNSSVSIQFREFGVRLKFLANPMPDGTINLKVAPEVSALDYTNAVTLAGFLIPALSTRKAETEVQLRDGQSFAVAGLLDNRANKINTKLPWLGDIPILGNLFKSTNFVQAKTELLVVVTPRLIKPIEPGQPSPLPEMPLPFLDQDSFDKKAGKRTSTPAS